MQREPFSNPQLKVLASDAGAVQTTYVKEDAVLLLAAFALTIAVSATTFYFLKML